MYPISSLWDVSYFLDCLLSQTDSLFGRRSPAPFSFLLFYLHWDSLTKLTKNKKNDTLQIKTTCSPWKRLLVFVDVLPCAPKGPSFRSGSPVDREVPFCCLCSTNKPQLARNKHTILCCTHASYYWTGLWIAVGQVVFFFPFWRGQSWKLAVIISYFFFYCPARMRYKWFVGHAE